MNFTVVDVERCEVGESPLWDARTGSLFWVDIPAGHIHCLSAAAERKRWNFNEPVSAIGLCEDGRLVVALRNRIALFDALSQNLTVIAEVEHAKPGMRFNDGKVGPDGAFWVGSMDASGDGEPAAALYRFTASGDVTVNATGLRTSNGLAWTADGRRMVHSDSRAAWIDVLDFDPATGNTANRRRLRDMDEMTGRPDGGAFDMDGIYWSAGITAGRLNRIGPAGTLLDWVDLPLPRPTMPCFGGPDGRSIFITSLRSGFSQEMLRQFPLAGATISIPSSVPGVPAFRFGV